MKTRYRLSPKRGAWTPCNRVPVTWHRPRHPWRDFAQLRYVWAERAIVVGYPERFAQLVLGHNSKAVHRAYSRRAQVTLPSLEEDEKNMAAAAIIPLPLPAAG